MAEATATIKLCTICGKEPRVGKSSFCIDCRRTYNRAAVQRYRRRRIQRKLEAALYGKR